MGKTSGEKCKKYWKRQGISNYEKGGNPVFSSSVLLLEHFFVFNSNFALQTLLGYNALVYGEGCFAEIHEMLFEL